MDSYLATLSTRITVFAILAACIVTWYRLKTTGFYSEIRQYMERDRDLIIKAINRFKKYGLKK